QKLLLLHVSVGVVINYKVSDPFKLYQDIGSAFLDVIIDPFTQESVKVVVANFTAEDIIQRRQEAKQRVIDELRMRLEKRHIQLVDFNFTHLDFSADFIHAVEEKQIAEQLAKTARNLTEKVKEEALQTMKRAEAEAFALKVKKDAATSSELIQLIKVEAQLKAIEKWDGVLPKMTGNQIPFINFS
ncbi:prohibitin family protein, partial [Candidatus Dependentiae bacterium]|nr:prohibitin family protein [Candidatus Dependentiae bacterium]